MSQVIIETPTGWELEPDDFGGLVVRHQHGDLTAVAYLYTATLIAPGPNARCVGAEVDLALPIRSEAATR